MVWTFLRREVIEKILSMFVSFLIVNLLSIQSKVPLDNRSTKTNGCQGDRHTLLIKVNFKHTKHFVGRTTLIEFFYLASSKVKAWKGSLTHPARDQSSPALFEETRNYKTQEPIIIEYRPFVFLFLLYFHHHQYRHYKWTPKILFVKMKNTKQWTIN